MANFKNAFSWLKKNAVNKLGNIKTNIKNGSRKFKENFQEAKSQPRSKRKSLFLGFSTVIGIFGVTLLTPVLSAVAKDMPRTPSGASRTAPADPPVLAPSKEIVNTLSGAAASICALAITSGSFALGAACGIIVAIGILKAQGK